MSGFQLGTQQVVRIQPTISSYMSDLTDIILGSALVFEMPVAAYILSKLGLLSGKIMSKYRKYAYVVILFVAAIITPSPDWYSQMIVAVPLIILYELCIVIARVVSKNRAKLAAA